MKQQKCLRQQERNAPERNFHLRAFASFLSCSFDGCFVMSNTNIARMLSMGTHLSFVRSHQERAHSELRWIDASAFGVGPLLESDTQEVPTVGLVARS